MQEPVVEDEIDKEMFFIECEASLPRFKENSFSQFAAFRKLVSQFSRPLLPLSFMSVTPPSSLGMPLPQAP